MGALTAVLMFFIFGILVGMVLGFLRAWKEIILHLLMGILIIITLIGVGSLVLTGNAGNSDPVQLYEMVGYVAYFIGLLIGDSGGQEYYDQLTEAL